LNANGALNIVLEELKNPKSDFSKQAFLKIIRLLPGIPNIPSANIFVELMRKNVPCGLDLAPIRNGQVFLAYRDDAFFKGWHFLGSHRTPYIDLLADCQRAGEKEMGENILITKVEIIDWRDRIDNQRFHDIGLVVKCDIEGEPENGEWFSEMPDDLIEIHKPHWPAVYQELVASRLL